MLLYVHVPFCRQKCRYCAFHSQIFDPDDLELYLRCIKLEISGAAARLGRIKLETVYFGGGTPSLLPEWALSSLLESLRQHFDWPSGIEATIEANPESGNELYYFKSLLSAGFNRLSLGVQSFNPEILQRLGRPHDDLAALKAFDAARAAGFRNISLDLIFGLPGQRLRLWLEELKRAVNLKPEHLSCYGLTLEPGTPLKLDVEKGLLVLPEQDEQAQMFVRGANFLEECGYLQYEISNFSRMGMQSKHNQGYWDGLDYLGLGPSAVSTVAGRRWENPKDIEEYAKLCRNGKIGEAGRELTQKDKIKELVMLSLRTAKGLDLKQYRNLSGRDLAAGQAGLLSALSKHGLLKAKDNRLQLTRNGMLVSNLILERLMFDPAEPGEPS